MSGSFVISLDFELMWGVRDHRSVQEYGDAVMGGRKAIPLILDRFKEAGIRATWATVGLLFAKNRDAMLDYAPTVRPDYENARLSPYPDIERGLIGKTEEDDPLHFGASLIKRIADTPGQEIATHTYSHYYCLEPGGGLPAFEADIEASVAIARDTGHKVQSIVFPRNQTTDAFIQQSAKLGVDHYRGSATGWLYRPRSGSETTKLFRLARFADGALPIGPKQIVQPSQNGSALDVPASRFLRPWSRKLALYQMFHIRRIEAEMKLAAQRGASYHLWWHPHNFGRNLDENLGQLDRIITRFKKCRDAMGMVSKNMRDFPQGHI
jgi:peptidoglycan/xylan/chitin deacetylase (PgdA/CDA1 family)